MATKSKVLSYNDIALRLNRINAQIHTGIFDAPLYGAEKEKQDTLIAQRDALQKQLEASTPKGQYTEDQIASAMTQIEKLTNQRSVLISQGAKSSDPALQQLGQQFQDQQAILDQAKKDQATIDKLKSDADSYIKDQNVQLNAKEKAASQAELDQTQLSNLQEKQAVNKAFGQTDPSIDAQIAALKEKTAQIPA